MVLLSYKKIDGHIDIDLDVEKIEGKSGTATHAEIKKYVDDHNNGIKGQAFIWVRLRIIWALISVRTTM